MSVWPLWFTFIWCAISVAFGVGVARLVMWWQDRRPLPWRLVPTVPLPGRTADAYAISRGLALMYHLDVSPTLIHVWATRGKIQRRGYDENGKTLYDLDEVLRHAGRNS